jgi:hypothetical protein
MKRAVGLRLLAVPGLAIRERAGAKSSVKNSEAIEWAG